MTAKQARRAAKILCDFATALPYINPHKALRRECFELARALTRHAEVQQIVEAPERTPFDATANSSSRITG